MRQMLAAVVATILAGSVSAQTTFVSTPNQPIPDNSPNGVTNTIVIPPTSDRIRSLRVGVRIQHTYTADLDIWLIPPGVTWSGPYTTINNGPVVEAPPGVIQLSTNNGSSGDNYGSTTNSSVYANFSSPSDTTWPAAQSVTNGNAPFTSQSQWIPEWRGAWDTMYGRDPSGAWTLAVGDGWALDTGTLLAWRIEYMPVTPPSLIVRQGEANRPGTPAVPGQAGQVLGQARIEAVGNNAISGVTVTAQNGVNIGTSLSQLALYADTNEDGLLDPGDTFLLAASLSGSTATFNFGASVPLTSGTTAALLLVGDVRPSPAATGLTLQITNAGAIGGATGVFGVFPVVFGFHPFASLRTYTSVPPGGRQIPNNQAYGVRDSIQIPPLNERAASIRVGVRIQHDRLQDIDMYLLPPGVDWSGPYTGSGPAGVIELSSDNGGNGDNYGTGNGPFVFTLFCSQTDPNLAWRANRNIITSNQNEAPFTHRPAYYPEDQSDFNALYNADPSGQWTLVVLDDAGQNNGGELIGWQIEYLAHPIATLAGNADLGSATVGFPSGVSPRTFTIGNDGDYPLAVSGITFVGAHAADFSRNAISFPVNVAPGGSFNFNVTFTPTADGVRHTTLRVLSNENGIPGTADDITIWGFGEMPDQLLINPGFNNHPGESFKHAETNAVFGQYEFATGASAVTVNSVTIREESNLALAANLSNLRLYHDTDNDGEHGPGDVLLGIAALGPTDGFATFNVGRVIGAQTFENWIVVGDVLATPVNQLLALEIRAATDVVASHTPAVLFPVSTGPRTLDSQRVFTNTHPGGLLIPNSSTVGVTSSIVIPPTTETIAAFRVGVRIDHPVDEDIEMWLIPPGVTWNGPYSGSGPAGVIELSSDNGGSGQDYGSGAFDFVYANFTSATDQVFTPSVNIAGQGTSAAPFTSTYYRPEDQTDFNARYGQSPSGTWTLAVRDDAGNQFTTGRLISWQIEYRPPATPVVTGLSDWGGSNVGAASGLNPQSYTITNVGGTQLDITGLSLAGANPGDWAFNGPTGAPLSLAPGSSHNLALNFAPTALGARAAVLRVTYNNGLQSGLTLNFSLTGLGTRGLIGVTTPVDYGSGLIGSPSSGSPVTHTVANTGNGPLTITGVSLQGTHAADWSLSGLPIFPVVIPVGGNLQFTGTLVADDVGTRQAIIRITSDTNNAPGTPTDIAVSGVGIAFGEIDVTSPVDYGQGNPGNASSLSPVTHQVNNIGASPLTVTSVVMAGTDAGDWMLSLPGMPVVIAPMGSFTFQATLTPSAVGPRNAIVRVFSDTGGVPGTPTDIVVFGLGTAGVIQTAGGPVDYGSANPGTVSSLSPRTHVISNIGNGPLTLSSIGIVGTHASEWQIISAPPTPVVIGPSGSINVQVQMTPGGIGLREATLRIESDSNDTPTQTNVALQAQGTRGVLSTDAGPVDYGAGETGTPSALSPRTHVLANTGDGPLTIFGISLLGTHAADWTLIGAPSGFPVIIPVAGSIQFDGQLVPAAMGARDAVLRIESDSNDMPTQTNVPLQGLGLAATTVSGVTVGGDTGGPVLVQALVSGPMSSLVDVTVTYAGGSNPGPAVLSDAGGLAVSGNMIQGIPANTTLSLLWDAYASERHTTASDYVLTLTPSQAAVLGEPGSSAPFTLQRSGGWAHHVSPEGAAPGVYSHTMVYDDANDRAVVFGGRDTGARLNTVWVFERSSQYQGWHQLQPAGTPPSGRQYSHAIYDAANQRMVVHGGLTDGGVAADTWALSLVRGSEAWTQIAAGSPPPARRSASLVVDTARNRALLFGGMGAGNFNDVWALDLATDTWSQLTPSGSPPVARFGHAAALDATGDRMLVIGGRSGTGDLMDVHELSLAGAGTWGAIAVLGTPPSPRYFTTYGWDAVNRRLILQCGYSGTTPQRDMWYLSAAGGPTWSQLPPDANAGTGRVVGGAVLDIAREELLFYGGTGVAGLTSPAVSVLDVSAAPAWAPSAGPEPVGPDGRWGGLMAWDHINDRVIAWGGKDHTSYFGDVWVLDQSSLTGEWTRLPVSGPQPAPRTYCAYAVDTVNNRLIIHGGGISTGSLTNELWTLDLAAGTWTQWPTGGGPAPRDQHVLVYDSLRNRAIIHGGRAPTPSNGAWAYNFDLGMWAAVALPAGPIGLYGHGATYDSVNDRMVVFGGRSTVARHNEVWALSLAPSSEQWTDISAQTGTIPTGRQYFGAASNSLGTRAWIHAGDIGGATSELWQLDLAGTEAAWTLMPTLGSAPLPRYLGNACISPGGMLYAGFGFLDNRGAADVWRYDTLAPGGGWTQTGGGAPLSLVSTSHAYDPVGNRLIAFGGLGGGVHQTGLWQLDLSSPVAEWSPLNVSGPSPSARRSASMVYDGSSSPPRMLMFGGRTAYDHASIVSELWALELSPGNEQWIELAPTFTQHPGARTNHGAVIDGSNRMIVYGGINTSGTSIGTVFALDLGTLDWSQLTPTGVSPPPRYSMAMVYDAPRNRIVIHGGIQTGGTLLADTRVLSLSGTPAWSVLSASGTGPGALYYAGAVVDPAGERMLISCGHAVVPQSRLFELDLATDTWAERTPPVARPQARWSHIAVWDTAGSRMVLAGGYLQGEVPASQAGGRADTWFWGE